MSGASSILQYIRDQRNAHADARDIIAGLVEHHRASLTFPTYRTKIQCGGVCVEAASCCSLRTARILIEGLERTLAADLSAGRGLVQP